MPIHVEDITSETTVLAGELPLTEAQIEKLVQLVLKRVAEKQRETQQSREATVLRRAAIPSMRTEA
jgi:hypothetical protein